MRVVDGTVEFQPQKALPHRGRRVARRRGGKATTRSRRRLPRDLRRYGRRGQAQRARLLLPGSGPASTAVTNDGVSV